MFASAAVLAPCTSSPGGGPPIPLSSSLRRSSEVDDADRRIVAASSVDAKATAASDSTGGIATSTASCAPVVSDWQRKTETD